MGDNDDPVQRAVQRGSERASRFAEKNFAIFHM